MYLFCFITNFFKGDHHIIRSDVVMDVGQSLNPNIDIGQVLLQEVGSFISYDSRLKALLFKAMAGQHWKSW